jgi:hypothetical protein
VNAVLQELLDRARQVLSENFVGLYVYGSLASGDFNPETSDIDFLVVTADEVSPEQLAGLETLHARLNTGGLKWASKLEGAYLPRHALRRHDPDDTRARPGVNEGRFALGGLGSDWVIQRYLLREQGGVIVGPHPSTFIDPVSADDLRQSVRALLREWWRPMLADSARLTSDDYQAYAVLSMCRALYTLERGQFVSKPVAARWAQQKLGGRWAALIERALAWRPGKRLDSLSEVRELIRLTLDLALVST